MEKNCKSDVKIDLTIKVPVTSNREVTGTFFMRKFTKLKTI